MQQRHHDRCCITFSHHITQEKIAWNSHLFAMYEKDGMHLEDVLMHMIRVKFLRPPVRKYETENYYETDPEQIRQSPDAGKPKGGKTVAKKEK